MRFGFDFLPEDVSEGGNTPTAVERTYVDKVTASDGVTYDIQDTVAMERVDGYVIGYSLSSDGTLGVLTSDVYKQAAIKILELINEGVRPIVYARVQKSLKTYTVPCVIDIGYGSSTKTSFKLTFVFSEGYDDGVLNSHNMTYDYEDTIAVSGSNVTHTIKKTNLRATSVYNDNDDFLYYWDLPLMYKPYEYFNATYYHGPLDEGNDYYQSVPFVVASCSDHHPADGSTFTVGLSDFSTIALKYPELPSMMHLTFEKYDEGQSSTGDAYWVPISKTIYETIPDGTSMETGEIKGFTGVFVDKDGNVWKVIYDIATSTGTINVVGGGSVDKYEIDLTVNVVGSTSTPTFTKINGYTSESDIIAQLHNLYLDLQAGKHPVITFNYFTNRESNTISTLCPVSASAVNGHHICFVWEWSVPTTSTADRIPATRYVNQLLTAHDGTSSNRFTYRSYTLT